MPSRAEATVRLSPFGRLALLGSASRTGGGRFVRIFGDFGYSPVYFGADGTLQRPPDADTTVQADPYRLAVFELAPQTSLRAEAGIKLYDVWLSAGLLRRDATTLLPAANLDTSYSRPGAMRERHTGPWSCAYAARRRTDRPQGLRARAEGQRCRIVSIKR